LGVIIGEWFGAEQGLGVLLQSAMFNYQIPLLWCAAFMAAAASGLVYCIAAGLERLASRRYPRPERYATPVVSRSPNRRSGMIWRCLGPMTAIGVLVAAWQAWVTLAHIDPILVPGPLAVERALIGDPGTLAVATLHTAYIALGGVVIGVAGGVVFALLAYWSAVMSGLVVPSTIILRAIPVVAMIPVIARVLGFTDRTVLAVAVIITFFPAFGLAASGLRATPPGSEDLFSVLSASREAEILHLRLPASVPHLLTAIRVSAPNAVLGALAAEWLIGQQGLGNVFGESSIDLVPGLAWGAIVAAIVMSVAAFGLATVIETRGRNRWA
jgi:sulfonate transport system permease protein